MCGTGIDCRFRFVPLDADAVDGLERVYDGGEYRESFGRRMIACVLSMQGARTSCCINWYDRRRSYISFTFFLFVFVYCIPLIVLFIANTLTMRGLKQMHDKIESGIQTTLSRKRVEMERRIARSKRSSSVR